MTAPIAPSRVGDYSADLADTRDAIRLVFSVPDSSGTRKRVGQVVHVASVRVGFGHRLWFGIYGRRVANFVLTPGATRSSPHSAPAR